MVKATPTWLASNHHSILPHIHSIILSIWWRVGAPEMMIASRFVPHSRCWWLSWRQYSTPRWSHQSSRSWDSATLHHPAASDCATVPRYRPRLGCVPQHVPTTVIPALDGFVYVNGVACCARMTLSKVSNGSFAKSQQISRLYTHPQSAAPSCPSIHHGRKGLFGGDMAPIRWFWTGKNGFANGVGAENDVIAPHSFHRWVV